MAAYDLIMTEDLIKDIILGMIIKDFKCQPVHYEKIINRAANLTGETENDCEEVRTAFKHLLWEQRYFDISMDGAYNIIWKFNV